jgi:hypothetical protein
MAIVGTATANKTGTTVTANVAGVITSIDVARDLAVVTGDVLLIEPFGGDRYLAVARIGSAAVTAPEIPVPVPPSKPSITTGKKVVAAYRTISRQGSRWRSDNDDVYQGEYSNGNHIGCAFYGNGFSSLSGSTVTRATVKMRRKNAGGITAAQDTTLRLVTEKTKPSGAPTLGSSTDGPNLRWGESTTFDLPDSWGQALVDGSAGGLAIYESDGSPYVILDGKGDYSASFTVTINWTRS